MTPLTTFSPQAVGDAIAEGHLLVILDNHVLRLDEWINHHPGGRLAILHMVGRDATDEIHAYHSAKTIRTMCKYRIGAICNTNAWANLNPPIRAGLCSRLGPFPDAPKSEPSSTLASTAPSESDSAPLSLVSSHTSHSPSSTSFEWSDISDKTYFDTSDHISSKLLVRNCWKHGNDGETARTSIHCIPALEITSQYNSDIPAVGNRTLDDHLARFMQTEIEDGIAAYPSLDEGTQAGIMNEYRALHRRVKDEGLYKCHFSSYAHDIMRYGILFAMFLIALHYQWYITSAVFLGLFWHQIMFTAHDAGHRGITHDFVTDTLIGMFVADFCCGLSIGWWKSSHDIHHLLPNHLEHDPDIQNVPLFATSSSFFKSVHSTYYDFTFAWDAIADIACQYQAYTYYPVMAIARFNLYFLSICHLLSRSNGAVAWVRPTELLFMLCYWYIFGYCVVWRSIPTWTLRIAFVLVSHLITMPLHVQITLSHWGMPTSDLGPSECFAQRQLRTTLDIDCPEWLDFIHGGLQFQACHHLFPRVPRHNLRKLQVLVREFCAATHIPYQILGFFDGNRQVLGRLGEVARQVKVLVNCQRHMAKTGESGLS